MPRVLYVVSEDWYFCWHWLNLARAARDAGWSVSVATRVTKDGDRLRAEGFELHPLTRMKRRSLNPFNFIGSVDELHAIIGRARPDLIHSVAHKPVVEAGFAGGPAARLNCVPGMGFARASRSIRARIAWAAIRFAYDRILKRPRSWTTVLNTDDRATLVDQGLADPGRITVVPGIGIDCDHYRPLPEPLGPFTIGFVSRMLRQKGVETAVEAVRRLRKDGHDIRLTLAGPPDPGNPDSHTEFELKTFVGDGIDWIGPVEDVRTVWARAHAGVLMSTGGEGAPAVLMEALACGRPVISTDTAGCRDIAIPDVSGIRLAPGDVDGLAAAIKRLALDRALRHSLGQGGRRLVEERFALPVINSANLALYERLVSEGR